MINLPYCTVTKLGENDSLASIKKNIHIRQGQLLRKFRGRIIRRDFWLKGNGRYIIVSSLILLILFGLTHVFVPRGVGQDEITMDERADWLRLATNAWNYFQPGQGVDSTTGLHKAGLYWPYITDWDLGLYIQAIIDAEKLGILDKTGTWGADDRFEKLLSFLETRELTSNNLPYLWYDSATKQQNGGVQSNACDSGKLLVALQNLRTYRPELASRINYLVYNRTNYELLKQAVAVLGTSVNIYDYYVARGFAGFWPENFTVFADSVIDNISLAPTVTDSYGVKLPISKLTGEPLLHCVFELMPNEKLMNLASQFYLAHETRYTQTGKFVAFSEGNTGLVDPSYVYEWVVYPSGQTWVLKGTVPAESDLPITPIIYFKVAVGLLAINNTAFTRSMVSYIESQLPDPSTGYVDGIDENGRKLTTTIDKTNGLIIGAAEYVIRNLILPTPTLIPTGSITVSPSPIPSSPMTSDIPSSSQSFSPSTTASSNPSISPSENPNSSPSFNSSISPSLGPSENYNSTNNDRAFWSIENIVIVVISVVGCLLLVFLLLMRLKRKDSSILKTIPPTAMCVYKFPAMEVMP